MITSPSEKSQEAMNAKTLRVPPALLGDDLPSGGTEGQVLTMGSAGPEWANVPEELPDGGTQGQVLTKGSEGVEWADPTTQAPYVMPVLSVMYSGAAVTLPSDTTQLLISSDLTVSETQNFTQFGRDIIKDMANFKRIPVLLNILGVNANALESVNCSFVMKDVNLFGEVSYIFSGIVGQNISSSPYAQPKLYNIRVVCIENEGTWTCASVIIRAIEASIGGAGFEYMDQFGSPSIVPKITINFKITSGTTLTPGTAVAAQASSTVTISNGTDLYNYFHDNNYTDEVPVRMLLKFGLQKGSDTPFYNLTEACIVSCRYVSSTAKLSIRLNHVLAHGSASAQNTTRCGAIELKINGSPTDGYEIDTIYNTYIPILEPSST